MTNVTESESAGSQSSVDLQLCPKQESAVDVKVDGLTPQRPETFGSGSVGEPVRAASAANLGTFLDTVRTVLQSLAIQTGTYRLFSGFGIPGLHFGMRGLNNFHLSCCVNTLLQTLSATWELADLLEKWEVTGLDSHNVPLQLKRVLSAMRSHLPQPAPHHDFLHCLDRNCIRLNTQHDADEVFLALLNLVQQQMDDKSLALKIQDLYRISVETHLQCLKCSSIQTQSSYLLSLPLHIKEDHNSLEDCMSSFFEHQQLMGINCCFCPACESNTPSEQAVKLLSLPPILCIHLKRFRNSRGYTRKLDCRVTFPETFDFYETVKKAFSSNFAQNDCRYSLYAVVAHSGTAMFGHYTAYIRHWKNQRWYYADDSSVYESSWEGVQSSYGRSSRGTAYMLMYRRNSKEGAQQPGLSG